MSERPLRPPGAAGVEVRETPSRTGAGAAAAPNAHQRALGGQARPVAKAAPVPDARAAFAGVQVRFDAKICRDLTRSSKKEWLLANGLGGYAMSTISGLNTRRWHGLLVAAMRPPVGRVVVLSKMEEALELAAGPLALDTNFYPGVVHPRGFENLESFALYPFPTAVFAGAGWRLEKTIVLVYGENTVVVTYKMLPAHRARRGDRGRKSAVSVPPVRPAAGSAPAAEPVAPLASLRLRLRPLFAFRAAGDLGQESERLQRSFGVRAVEQHGSILRVVPFPEWEPVYLVCRQAPFVDSSDWYKNLEYPQERYRGLEFREDLWSYGYYAAELRTGESISIACTLHPPEKRTHVWPVEKEIQRRMQVMQQVADDSPLARRLGLAAEQFLVKRDRDLVSIAAGYPWMSEHARDTMVALPGLLLVTGRHREAKSVLRTWARTLDRGLLPNHLPDGTGKPEFGSVDATLWFFVAVFKFLQYTGDFDFVKTELRIPMLETVRYFGEGSRHGVRVESDGLLRCGEPGMALTWMDARANDQPVTPRPGKPVEVNALWYNALRILERLAERFSIPSDMARFGRMAEKVEESFLATYWNEALGCLADVVDHGIADAAIRPNQILAVSLPFPLLDSESAQSVVRTVGQRLLTPFGLRTLDPSHSEYRGIYDGDPKQRHAAYHQGTVWSWLLGPYISALVKANGAPGRLEAGKLLEPFHQHLTEDGLGQVSEIFWGNAPHWPRGCPAHAAAVGELLRAYHEDVLGKNPGRYPGVREPALRRR
jgi:predicted glycogen debranching enzyme